ncbi:MAG TPA: YihY/virulence factor BrkB family protein [Jatrophihabitans sp.]|uniref:YihY/virulence factor BrkB family protein n=1 Tax=Jatrophihabitans sp. TaxID=1932789 RepID=UPI002F19C21B
MSRTVRPPVSPREPAAADSQLAAPPYRSSCRARAGAKPENRSTTMTSKTTSKADRAPDELSDLSDTSWKGVLKRSVKEFKNDNLSDWAAALTYRGVLTLAPGLLVMVSMLGLLGESTTDKLVENVGSLTPGGVRSVFEQILESVQSRNSAGLAALFGLALAWWSASSYIAAFMRASNAIYEMGEGRPIWKTVPLRLAITLAMAVLGVLAAVIVVFSGPLAERVGQALGVGDTGLLIWSIAKWPVLIVIVSVMLAVLYYAAPNVKQPGIQWVSPGGVLAVLIWIVASAGFAFYVSNFGSYNKTYGSLASVIIFLIWLWITNIAILLGAEFNAELQHARAIEAGQPPDETPFAEPRDTRKLTPDKQKQATGLENKN